MSTNALMAEPSGATVVFTIIAKNYLAAARTLMDSVGRHCPEALRVVVLVDSAEDYFCPEDEDFEVVDSLVLEIPKRHWFHFKYAILELSTAVKPYAIQYLFRKYAAQRIIYFDPDIRLYGDLEHLYGLLETANIVLTPHLTEPLRDARQPGELDILRSGAYNLGFIGLRRTEETFRMLRWWREKLYDQCVVDIGQGLFVDQKWMDLVPGMFDGVAITRRAGYNVAYWNVQHRLLSREGGRMLVNGEPLCFFHFSGYNPMQPEVFSRHQNRYTMEELGVARDIVAEYGRELVANGHAVSCRWPYAFAYFDNGVRIPELCRPVHHESTTIMSEVANPFSEDGFAAFVAVWNARLRPDRGITKLAHRIYQMRADVMTVMPDLFGRDYHRFLEWFVSSGKAEHALDAVFVAPLEEELAAAIAGMGAGIERGPDAAGDEGKGGSSVTALIERIHQAREDLQRLFPEPNGGDQIAYLRWVLSHGSFEYALTLEERVELLEIWRQRTEAVALHRRLALRFQLVFLQIALRMKFRAKRRMAVAKAGRLRVARPGRERDEAHEGALVRGAHGEEKVVNLVGYAAAATGVGQSVRAAESAIRSGGFRPHIIQVELDGRWSPSELIPGAPAVFHINADQSAHVIGAMNGSRESTRPCIGYWAWELETFSSEWIPAFDHFDEIWTPSDFCTNAMAKVSPKPVISVPHPIHVEPISGMGRTDFGVKDGEYVFLSAFDMLSVFQRKNPLAVIRAFRRAFAADERVRLIVKVNNGEADRNSFEKLVEAAGDDHRISIINNCLARGDMNALLASCDCFVSLHRSEGFGLMIAEAMWLGKPVIVTGYSGNMDFTNADNAFLVGYDYCRVGEGCAPYDAEQSWAEPRDQEASAYMKLVFEQPELGRKMGSDAQRYVRRELSAERVGAIVEQRLSIWVTSERP